MKYLTADAALSGEFAYLGLRVAAVGEDAEVLIEGHPDAETLITVLTAYAEEHGLDEDAAHDAADRARSLWGRFADHAEDCDEDGCYCDEYKWWWSAVTSRAHGAVAITVVEL